ncbi:hypothetical protein ONZ51_g10809 [Trametes cubensis]|uniref:Uncharacterized protein n=1 Tax=Trametes cubensis TaxID=1111947 RepID=A0AAD7X4J5_9APHY|nr:hypothetical protein ONZ51_g10809 [Trametes cubensis]
MPRKTPNSRNHPPSKDSVSKTCEKPLNLPQYWLDDETHAWLIKQCGERLESWAKMCFEDPGFARRCVDEYRLNRINASQTSLPLTGDSDAHATGDMHTITAHWDTQAVDCPIRLMPAVRMSISHVDLTMVTALVLLWTKISSWLVILAGWRNLDKYKPP